VYAESGDACQTITVDGQIYLIVGSSDDRLEDYGIARRSQTSMQWTCTTCPENKTQCQHLSRAGEKVPRPSRDELQSRLGTWLDADSGCRRMTCMSSKHVPEDVSCSEHAEQYQRASPSPAEHTHTHALMCNVSA
jgi:hypothetical protein